MKKIQRPKGLKDNLREMPVGESCEIATVDYKPNVVRSILYVLNTEGYHFTSTEKGMISAIRVTRVK